MDVGYQISSETTRAVHDMGYEEATPIQAAAIPYLMEGRDIIGQAQTGTGKTAAFGIPLVEVLDSGDRRVQALVLCPTRELALQVAGELLKFGRYHRNLSVLPVYGGQPIERQLRGLSAGAQIVVGTPGRVMDHMRRGSLDLSAVKMVVLDEADEMLDMGFRDDIETILQGTPDTRQTALFSATMPRTILHLAKRYLNNPKHIEIERRELTVETIRQSYFTVRSFHKTELLARLVVRDHLALTLVFVNTKRGVEEVVTDLTRRGLSTAGLHGDMRQIERDAIMSRFRNGLISILVATDVAARGLDVDNIDAVINYDMPQDVEYYVHRIGRTGRAGREGRAYTFVVGREMTRMWDYRRITGAKILCEQAPTAKQIQRAQAELMIEKVADMDANAASQETEALAEALLERMDARTAVTRLLDILTDSRNACIDMSVDLTPPAPVKSDAPYAARKPVPHGQSNARSGGQNHARVHVPRRSDNSRSYARQK